MKINYFIKYWLPVIFYMIFIFYLSSLPNPIEQVIPGKALPYFNFDHFIYHIIEYLILSFLLYRALKTISEKPEILTILISTLYAITDEMHQYFVPGRISSVFDISFDIFGIIAMQCIIYIYNNIKNQFYKFIL